MDEALFEQLSGIADGELPRMVRVRWRRPSLEVDDIEREVRRELERLELSKEIEPGAAVAITAGSRGIANIAKIIGIVVQYLKEIDGKPFVFPAMGSHGGATAPGQVEVLKSLGITEEALGCPIRATMEVVELGRTPSGIPVSVDRYAAEADHVFVINRVKPHTALSGRIGSGLLKMMAIGAGKQRGARTAHRFAFALGLERSIREIAQVIMKKMPIRGGLALVEGFHHETAYVKALRPEEFFEREPELLEQAKRLMPHLPFAELDLLIVDEAGKGISGTGMDTQVIGRQYILNEPEPKTPRIKRIYLRGLSPAAEGNGLGIGLADFVHSRVLERLDLEKTYINALTGTGPEKARIPPHFGRGRTAIKLALATIGPVEPSKARVLWIKNTLELEGFYISEALISEAEDNPELEIDSELFPLSFDDEGNLTPP
ncbi:MAG: lactate racemase domain-containing protein [Candidatus Bipolaricaulia bacterium]